ncbi:peptidase E [Bacillus sp. N1-1]|uniref:Type 1 glutamine amidotransferase-like domain-containing protein n=1 Tax=Bacillus sp. N1-1 TaxID=2682541 RepID=UPI00131788A5|nr:peptidase E [Bacillus sp. N1-1]QHA90813.1 peptidase E [Bacillus sp. N1-1]
MKQIIAMGGGGFSMEPDNPLLDRYILKQSLSKQPKICFIPTASGDADGYIAKFYAFFEKELCVPSHLSLFKPPVQDLEAFLLSQDILYVGGGNTKNLLALWKEWGLDQIMRKAWEKGIVLAGISAGAICWFEKGVTDSFGDELHALECLGFLPGSSCPHFDGEEKRRSAYHELIDSRHMQPGIALDDGAAVHYVDKTIKVVVSSRKEAYAYKVERMQIGEERLETVYLGNEKEHT